MMKKWGLILKKGWSQEFESCGAPTFKWNSVSRDTSNGHKFPCE